MPSGARAAFRRLTFSVYAPAVCIAIGYQATLILLPLLVLEVGGGPAAAAAVLGMRGIGTMISDLPSGVAVTRLGDKITMVAGIVLVAVACTGIALAGTPWMLGAFALVLGAGFGALMLGRLNYVARQCPVAYRGRAITLLAGIQRVGLFVGPAAGGLVAEVYGYPVAFVAAALLNVAGLVLIAIFVRRSRVRARGGSQPHGAVIARILRDHRREFTRGGIASVSMQFVRSARQVLIPLWGEAIGLDAASIGLVFGLSSAVDAAMFYPAGRLMDFRGRKWSLVPSLAILGASLALMPFTSTFWTYLAVALLAGIGNGFGTGIIMALGADLSPRTNRGEFLGVWRLLGDTGHAAGPFVFSAVTGVFALGATLGLAGAVGFAGAAVSAWLVPETLRRRPPPPESPAGGPGPGPTS
ncbi:MAG: MFS transporter [Immundisolibacterales bacterium]|nr:MFS transporter [Immundisolibacterales bacterium]